MHRHLVERLVERGEEPDDFEVGLLAQDVERPRRVLAGTPGEEDSRVGLLMGTSGYRVRPPLPGADCWHCVHFSAAAPTNVARTFPESSGAIVSIRSSPARPSSSFSV